MILSFIAKYKYCFISLAFLLVFIKGYYYGSSTTEHRYELKIAKQQEDYQAKFIELHTSLMEKEHELQEKANKTEEQAQKEIELARGDYESVISDIHSDKYIPSGLYNTTTAKSADCPMPKATANTDNIKCYTERELRSRIERSLAIGEKCNELAIKYNNLLLFVKDTRGDNDVRVGQSANTD